MAGGRPTRDATRLKVITARNKSVIAPENIWNWFSEKYKANHLNQHINFSYWQIYTDLLSNPHQKKLCLGKSSEERAISTMIQPNNNKKCLTRGRLKLEN